MSVPPEIAWLVPVIIPFIIGLLVGVIVKRAVKLIFAIVALVIILVVIGAISLGFSDIYDKAMEFLPKLTGSTGVIGILPYSSAAFLVGLALGLWRG